MDNQLKVPWNSRWRIIPEFPNYYISQHGDVFNMQFSRLKSTFPNPYGVPIVSLSKANKTYIRTIRKLLSEIHSDYLLGEIDGSAT